MPTSDRRLASLAATVERTPTPRNWMALLRGAGVSARLAARIVDARSPAARAVPRPLKASRALTSRLGGLPDVGAGFRWPSWKGEVLSFVGQLRIAELPARVRVDLGLPADGLLAFFYAADEQPWGSEPADAGAARIYYWPIQKLARAARPARLPAEPIIKPHGLRFVETEIDCSVAAAGLVRERLNMRSTRARNAVDDSENWTLLFHVDSDERRGMCWGDSCGLYFWMRRADLAAMAVDRAWCVIETT